jgi:hypothetical protein
MFARILLSLAVVGVTGCTGQSPLDTPDQLRLPREARTVGPHGLEQRLTVAVDPEDFREPGFHTLLVTSNLTNTAAVTVPVTARVCLFFESDVQITAEADRFEPLISCGAVQQRTQLAPGASLGPMEVRYRLRSGTGVYTVRVRHALDPEFRAEASFRIP